MKDIRMNPKLLDTINFSTEELLNEDCIGRVNLPNNVGECKIYIYSDEGNVPHFHIIPNNRKEECCICIYQPLYFNHGSKQMRLNSKQRKILNDWMNSPSKVAPEVTNWRLISIFWQTGNGNKNVPKNPIQPNYNDLANMRN